MLNPFIKGFGRPEFREYHVVPRSTVFMMPVEVEAYKMPVVSRSIENDLTSRPGPTLRQLLPPSMVLQIPKASGPA
jgi:hypothetical protein